MMEVKKESQINEVRQEELGVENWSTWSKPESRFEWSYSDSETCYILEG
ncbi:MAG: cupin domain-containing protein, partial [bacterium]